MSCLTLNFSVFDFDFWTSEVTSGRKLFAVRKPTHDLQSNFFWDFLSISYSFWDIWLQSFQGLTLTFALERSTKVKNIFVIQKPIHDFLCNFCWHFSSISYRVWDIPLQSL